MDALSDTILDIGFSDEARLPLTVNIQHPYPATAVSIMRAMRSSMIRELKLPSDSLPEVSVEVWINHFKKKALENSVKASSSSRILVCVILVCRIDPKMLISYPSACFRENYSGSGCRRPTLFIGQCPFVQWNEVKPKDEGVEAHR